MNRPAFEEVQRLRDNRWIWVMVAVFSTAAFVPLLYGSYWQLIKGEPWGNEPLSNQGFILFFLFILLAFGIMLFILLSSRLELKIEGDGIHWKFYPIRKKWQLISKDEIQIYSLEKKFKFFAPGGLGYHHDRFRKLRSMRISGGSHLSLKLRNGERYLFGTQDLAGMEWAMKKLMNKTDRPDNG